MHPTTRRRSVRVALAAAAFAAGCGAPTPEVTEVRVTETSAPAVASGAVPTAEIEDPALADVPKPRGRQKTAEHDPPPSAAFPPDDLDRARALFDDGAAAYANADYQTACLKFEAAYQIVQNQALLFNLGSCELRLGQTAKACAHFRQYVAGGDPGDPRIQQVSAQVANRCP